MRKNRLDCGDPNDGRPTVVYISCGHLVCEDHAGAHTCRITKHATLPAFDKKRSRT